MVHKGFEYWNFKSLISDNIPCIFLFGALVIFIPESGPHLVFVILSAEGVIPFSVLSTSFFVRDGHGMLPLLSYTVKYSIQVKTLKLIFALGMGMILYLVGW